MKVYYFFFVFVCVGFQLGSAEGLQLGGEGMRKSSTLICAPIVAESVEKMVVDMGRAKAVGADLVEIRLDHLKVFNCNQDVKTLIEESPLPTLFTYRYYYYCFTKHILCD